MATLKLDDSILEYPKELARLFSKIITSIWQNQKNQPGFDYKLHKLLYPDSQANTL